MALLGEVMRAAQGLSVCERERAGDRASACVQSTILVLLS